MKRQITACVLAAAAMLAGGAGRADAPAGIFKIVKGGVSVQRNGASVPATVGMPVFQSDRIVTGADGSAGITFEDNALLSLGPSSALSLDRFAFNSTTHEGAFETTLSSGKLAVVSGKIAHHEQDAMKVRTPSTILGVRGTKFLVEAGGT
ncbi:MAG: FecR domain-containing protein [Nevskia sp.]|nr:FecR domain-containing protein [Nevskia sp.]